MRCLLKTSEVSNFGDTSRASENVGGDIRLPAETVSLIEDGDFQERTAESNQQLPQSF
jgi:hypothetical protein